MKQLLTLVSTLVVCAFTVTPVAAQTPVPPPAPQAQQLSSAALDQLLGPIALYPDPLIAQILPAATLPAQIVLADRYVVGGGDPNQIGQQAWDANVQAVAHYPTVLKWMDDNLAWTTALGQAFLNQQQDVMDSIQRLRALAQNHGNLLSTPQQQVVVDAGDIEVLPADPQVVYVPVYSPDQVYDQSGFGLSFGLGFPIGGWLNCDFDWHHHNLFFWGQGQVRPANWWQERPDQRAAAMGSHTAVWRPSNRPGLATANRGDRGWNVPAVRSAAPGVNQAHNVSPVNAARPASAPAISRAVSAPAQRSAPASRPASGGAFIGSQSSSAARTFSSRGQQSMGAVTRSAPASRPAPSSNGGGGNRGKR